jgi:hypothetical protein
MAPKSFHTLIARLGERAKMPFPIHSHMLRHACGLRIGECRPRHASAAGMAGASQYPAHGALQGISSGSFPKFLAFVTASNVCSSR